MRARWVKDVLALYKEPTRRTIGHTIIACWWPGKYYLVMTIDMTIDADFLAAANAVARQIGEPPRPNYVTGVFRCDEIGGRYGEALHERDYPSREEAERGHATIVTLLAKGRRAW